MGRGRSGFGGGVWRVVSGDELTRFEGRSWRVELGGKRRVFLSEKEKEKGRVCLGGVGFGVVGVRRGKGFGCL